MPLKYLNILNVDRYIKKISLSLVLLTVSFAVCVLCLLAVGDMIFEDKNLHFDEHIFKIIYPYINKINTSVFTAISFFGSAAFLGPANVLLALFFLFIKKDNGSAWKIAAVSITNITVLLLLKNVLQRQRPIAPLIAKANDYSFPSGHTFSSVVFYGMLSFISYHYIENNILRWWSIILLSLLALAIGFSRVYLRMHYASDVIAGFSLGIIWLILAKWILINQDQYIKNESA